ncbi:MAG: major facilitator superfamily domain-containing protein [Monoraphidium minutum]|nr:MAG: major facilitator superfamily domain-containing protein [Monoraphidium minutum]
MISQRIALGKAPLVPGPRRAAALRVRAQAQRQQRAASASDAEGEAARPIGARSLVLARFGGAKLLAAPGDGAGAAAPQAGAAPELQGAAAGNAVGAWWDAQPSRYKVLLGGFMSFVICNMDKVNMSVAIIPMAHDFGWSPSVAGLVQSSFFWGYILSQLPGGYLTSRFGGRRTLPAGVAMWSLATAAVPTLAATVPGLCFSRAAVGLGEAVAPSAATDMVARIVPAGERSRAVSFVFAGLHFGSIAGLLAAPWIIGHFGWPSVFVAFGGAGLVWTVWFESLMADLRRRDPETAAALTTDRLAAGEPAEAVDSHGGHAAGPLSGSIPWRAFLRSPGVRALMYTHFCNNWFHYTMLAWLPTYFVDTLSVDLMHAAQTALLPPLAGIAASAIAGPASDAAIAAGVPIPVTRKAAQSVAFLVPTACLLAAAAGADDLAPAASVALITAALGVSSFSLAGLYCTHQDLSPKYSSALLGLTNTAGAVPGIIGVTATGLLYDATGSWAAALFLPTAFFLTTGAAVYGFAGRNAPEDFDAPGADAPFDWELRLRGGASGAAGRALARLGLRRGGGGGAAAPVPAERKEE